MSTPAEPPRAGSQPEPEATEEPSRPPIIAPREREERKSASLWVVLGLALIAGLTVGIVAWAMGFQDPCGDKIASERFSYCVTVPQGWESGPALIGSVEVDQYAEPAGAATIIVRSEALDGVEDLDAYAQQVRDQAEAEGMEVAATSEALLDGQPALVWSTTVAPDEGDPFELIQIATIEGGEGWTITLSDHAADIEASRPIFERLLQSWRFA